MEKSNKSRARTPVLALNNYILFYFYFLVFFATSCLYLNFSIFQILIFPVSLVLRPFLYLKFNYFFFLFTFFSLFTYFFPHFSLSPLAPYFSPFLPSTFSTLFSSPLLCPGHAPRTYGGVGGERGGDGGTESSHCR